MKKRKEKRVSPISHYASQSSMLTPDASHSVEEERIFAHAHALNFLFDIPIERDEMGHQQLYWSHPRKYGQGSRSWSVLLLSHVQCEGFGSAGARLAQAGGGLLFPQECEAHANKHGGRASPLLARARRQKWKTTIGVSQAVISVK